MLNTYTYTLETIIQAGRKRIPMVSVPVRVNRVDRPSRLLRGIGDYVRRSAITILRVFVIYAPLRFFLALAALFALPGLAGIGRFLYYYMVSDGAGHVQSLILSGVLLAMATILLAVGILADLIAANRGLLEEIRARELLRSTREPLSERQRLNTLAVVNDLGG